MYTDNAFFWWALREASWTMGYLETGGQKPGDRRVNALRTAFKNETWEDMLLLARLYMWKRNYHSPLSNLWAENSTSHTKFL